MNLGGVSTVDEGLRILFRLSLNYRIIFMLRHDKASLNAPYSHASSRL